MENDDEVAIALKVILIKHFLYLTILDKTTCYISFFMSCAPYTTTVT